jgi:hypothetical protein
MGTVKTKRHILRDVGNKDVRTDYVVTALNQVGATVISSAPHVVVFEATQELVEKIKTRWKQYGWEVVDEDKLTRPAPPIKETESNIELYAVRNRDGQWFRAKGYGGAGLSWVDSLASAKIYPKLGQARSRATFFATNYPQYGVPDVVKLKVVAAEIEDQTQRVKKSQAAKERKELLAEKRKHERELERAQVKVKEAQILLDGLLARDVR